MKTFAVVLAVGLVAVAQAQDQCAAVAAKVPTCAVQCIASAASGVGCSSTDFACQCKPANNAAINSAALDCVVKGCGAVTGLAVQGSASAVCACAATAAPASATSSAVATTSAVATSTAAPATSSAAVVATSASSTTSAPYPSTTASTTAAAAPVASSPSASGTGAVKASGSTTPFTGAAVKAVASVAAVLGAFVAIMAAL